MPETKNLLPAVEDLAAFLAERLPDSPNDSDVPLRFRVAKEAEGYAVRRIAFALDSDALRGQHGNGWDALFLHRPFDLPPDLFPGIPIFAAHRTFDTHFGLGDNPIIAETLGLTDILPLFRVRPNRADERIGMVGILTEPCEQDAFLMFLEREFAGRETELRAEGIREMKRVAVVGAMTPELIRQAADAGAQVYITGQFRENARRAAVQAGITVVAVGHRRSELWGLRRLAHDCALAFPGLETRVFD